MGCSSPPSRAPSVHELPALGTGGAGHCRTPRLQSPVSARRARGLAGRGKRDKSAGLDLAGALSLLCLALGWVLRRRNRMRNRHCWRRHCGRHRHRHRRCPLRLCSGLDDVLACGVLRSGRGEVQARGGEARRAPAGPTSEALVPRAGLMKPAWRTSTVSGVDDVAADRTPDEVRHPIPDHPTRHELGGVVDPLLRAFGLMVIEVLLGIQEVPRHNWLLASRAQDEARDEVQEPDDGEADNEDLEQFDIAFACADCKQARVQTGTGMSGEASPEQATHPHSGKTCRFGSGGG